MDPLTSEHSGRVVYPMTGHFRERLGYAVYRPRGRGDWLVICTLSGCGIVRHRHGSFLVHAFDVVLIKPDAEHGYATASAADMAEHGQAVEPGAVEAWELVWAHFHAPLHWLEHMDWPERAPGVMHVHLSSPEAREKVVDHLNEAHRIMSGFTPRQVPLAMNAIEAALLWCDTCNPALTRTKLDPRIRDVMDHMSRSLNERFSLVELARLSHLSPSRFAHLFKSQTGQTPVQFLEQQRIARARQLLELTSYPISYIAEQVGFDNPFYFTRRFTRATGMSPRTYRQRLDERSRESLPS